MKTAFNKYSSTNKPENPKRDQKRKRLNNLKEYFRFIKSEINKHSGEINEFIANADSYLHYSNNILFEICNTSSITYLIVLKVSSAGQVTGLLIFILKSRKLNIFYREFIDVRKIFTGVIERYCGTPP